MQISLNCRKFETLAAFHDLKGFHQSGDFRLPSFGSYCSSLLSLVYFSFFMDNQCILMPARGVTSLGELDF